jgi:hypothetical protein
MPGSKYYLRQANAFLSLAQETTDAQLRERYLMMADRYRALASLSTEGSADQVMESAEQVMESAKQAVERMTRKDLP